VAKLHGAMIMEWDSTLTNWARNSVESASQIGSFVNPDQRRKMLAKDGARKQGDR